MHEFGAGREESAHRSAGEVHGLRQLLRGEPWQGCPGPRTTEAAYDDLVVVGPLKVNEPVGQRRAQLPAVGRRGARIGGSHDPDLGRQLQGADPPLEHEAEQGGLNGRRCGGQLVQEQQPSAGPYQSHRPVRRGHGYTLFRGVVSDDGQAREVGRLVHTGYHCGQRKVQGRGKLCQGRGLADPRLTPQEHGQIGGHGQGQGLQLWVGARFGGCVTQQGQQRPGDVELGGVGHDGGSVGSGGRGACGHV